MPQFITLMEFCFFQPKPVIYSEQILAINAPKDELVCSGMFTHQTAKKKKSMEFQDSTKRRRYNSLQVVFRFEMKTGGFH